MSDDTPNFDWSAIEAIVEQFTTERKDLWEKLFKPLMSAMPWGLSVDLGNGRIATLKRVSETSRIFDWVLENCDQDHIEMEVKITGGGGFLV